MINFNNHNITEIHYNGHHIQKAYGCDGRLVWEEDSHDYSKDNLTIVALEDNVVVSQSSDYGRNDTICYSKDDGETWTTLWGSSLRLNAGEKAIFSGRSITDVRVKLRVSGRFDLEGNASSIKGNNWSYMFQNCTGLTHAHNLIIPYAVYQGCRSMFQGCTNLVTPPQLPQTTVSNWCFAYMFAGCTSLTKSPVLYAENILNTKDCSLIQNCYTGMFSGCTKLSEISCLAMESVPRATSAWTRNVAEHGVFYKNSRTKASDIRFGENGIPYGWVIKNYPPTPDFKWFATYSDSHTSSAECDSTSAITQNEITKKNLNSVEIGDCVTSIGNSAFFNFSQLTSITIPDSVTSIGSNAFAYCTSLPSVNIPDSITLVEGNAFFGCTSLTSVTIPSGVTEIRSGAFRSCTSLSSITMPNSVRYIGNGVFYDCSGLTSITVESTEPPILGNVNAFSNTNNCPIYVPAASVEAYKSASGWSTYADRIQPIQ